MPTIDDPSSRIEALLDEHDPRIASVFRTAIAALKDEVDLDELEELIRQGRLDEAIDRLRYAAEETAQAANFAFIDSGQTGAEFLRGAGVGRIVFDAVNLNAVAAMQAARLEMIREFTDEQRKATSAALIAGVEAGINPKAQARNFRDSIGLTATQWSHVASYRAALERVGTGAQGQRDALARELRDKRGDRSILAALRRKQPIPAEKIDWLVQRYADKYVKFRAEVIGRTEALRSVHQGNEELYRQAIANGVIEEREIERSWRTRLDGRERKTHRILNGVKRGWNEPWQTVNGLIRYPGDPEAPAIETIQCRCALQTRIRLA